jgi:GT2 family glycosyltransferase
MTDSVHVVSAGSEADPDSPSVAVVVVNFNGTADTLRCLESLARLQSGRGPTIVVDNGSTPDASVEIATAHPWAIVIRREVNGGWAGGNNEGIKYAQGLGVDRVILLNNDTTVSPDLVDRLVAAARIQPEYGILGPVICFMEEPSAVMTDGCDFNVAGEPGFFHRHPVAISTQGEADVTEVDIVNGCCMMIDTEVFRRIGLIDERFFLIHEESDFCLRARLAGFRSGVLGEPLVWHKGSSSFQRTGQGIQRYYDARNLYLLLKKHRATCRGGRGRLKSWGGYVRYVYHRYCIERELGESKAAEAVARGLLDALSGRFGALEPARRSFWLPWVMGTLELGRRVRAIVPGRRGVPA